MRPRIGIVGLGSIGTRHARVFRNLGAEVVALRSGHGRAAHPDLADVISHREWESFVEGLSGVVVATPTALHGASLSKLVESGIPALVEKPLVSARAELPHAAQLKALEPRVRVAYCLRFHPVVTAIRQCLEEVAPLRGRFSFGFQLPRFHPGVDYRREYSARRDLGGGALRTLSHELDLAQHLLGPFDTVQGENARLSSLEIDVDDYVGVVARMKSGARAMIDIDLFSPSYERSGTLVGERARIDYRFGPDSVVVRGADSEKRLTLAGPDMYEAQASDFLGWLEGAPSRNGTLAESLDLLRVMEEVERPAHVTEAP